MSALTVSESTVRAVQAPEATSTWHPFPHALLLDELEFVRELSGLELSNTRYELSKDGRRMFGVWTFMAESYYLKSSHASIGFRNSIDKTMSVGLTAGTYVVVCSNMAFSGEWENFRKHTKNVLEDLKLFALQAFSVCLKKAKQETIWQDNLNCLPLTDEEWKCLTYDALYQYIIPPTKINAFLDPVLERSVGVWFNVATNILSQRSLLNTEHEYTALKKLVSPFVEVV